MEYSLIHLLRSKASQQQVEEMLEELKPIIKLAVDIERNIIVGGGQMHADCEAVLLDNGSHQENIWGANWIPETQSIEFEALINIRPKQKNSSMIIQDPVIKQSVENLVKSILEGV